MDRGLWRMRGIKCSRGKIVSQLNKQAHSLGFLLLQAVWNEARGLIEASFDLLSPFYLLNRSIRRNSKVKIGIIVHDRLYPSCLNRQDIATL